MTCGWCGEKHAFTVTTCPACRRSARGYEDTLISAAHDTDSETRRRAIRLLGQVGSARTLAAFGNLLRDDPDHDTAREIVRATVSIGGPGARRLLEWAAQDSSPLVRRLVRTLGHLDRP